MSKPQHKRDKPDPPTAHGNIGSIRPLLPLLAILAVALIVGLKPISSNSLWWDLARGRAVVAGSFTPSCTLLALDTTAEADWLSGVLPFALYSFMGASALMVVRIGAAVAFALWLRRQMQRSTRYLFGVVLVTSFVVVETAFDPGPLLFDIGLICLVYTVIRVCPPRQNLRRACFLTLVTFALFANVAPHVVCGVFVLPIAIAATPGQGGRKAGWSVASMLAAAIAGCCLTPRGMFTLWDSARQTFPWLVADAWMLRETPWQPLHVVEWNVAECLFIGWCVVFLVLAVRNRSLAQVASLAGVQLLAWPSSYNLPIAGAWLACATAAALTSVAKSGDTEPAENASDEDADTVHDDAESTAVAKSTPTKTSHAKSTKAKSRRPNRRVKTTRRIKSSHEQSDRAADARTGLVHNAQPVVATLAAGLLLYFGFGVDAMGWGIHARLDDRLCRLALEASAEPGVTGNTNGTTNRPNATNPRNSANDSPPLQTAFCDDVRSAGLLCWIAPSQILTQDVPIRALLGGRLAQHVLIRDDLHTQHRASYWRDDGSRGGWWLALADRNTELLMLSSTDTTLIRSLEPTIWKPLALDAPVLPYAKAGAPRYAEQLVNTLGIRELVNFGSWVYTSPQTTRSQFDRDRWGWRVDLGNAADAVRQARVFRSMQLHHAALKVLRVAISRWPDEAIRAEFVRCQAELAHAEMLVAGTSSDFRHSALVTAWSQTRKSIPLNGTLVAHDRPMSPQLPQAVTAYLSGDVEGALSLLTSQDPQVNYARACLFIESGQPDQATETLAEIIRNGSGSRLALIADRLRRKMEGAY